jgi:hypothetical protein
MIRNTRPSSQRCFEVLYDIVNQLAAGRITLAQAIDDLRQYFEVPETFAEMAVANLLAELERILKDGAGFDEALGWEELDNA